MLRNRMILTMVSSSMLPEISSRINMRLPPCLRPVRYSRFPSPTRRRVSSPVSLISSCSCFFCSSSFLILSFSRSSSTVSVLSDSWSARDRVSWIFSMMRRAMPCATTSSSSISEMVLRVLARLFLPSRISSSSSMTSAVSSRVSTGTGTLVSTLCLMMRNNSTTEPKPQDMMSRNDRLKGVSNLFVRISIG